MRTNKILSTAWLCIYSPPSFVFGENKSNKDKYIKSLQRGWILKKVDSPHEGSEYLTGVVLPLCLMLSEYWKRGVWQKQFPEKVKGCICSCFMWYDSHDPLYRPFGNYYFGYVKCREKSLNRGPVSHTSIFRYTTFSLITYHFMATVQKYWI